LKESDNRRRHYQICRDLFGDGIVLEGARLSIPLLNIWSLYDPISNPISRDTAPNVSNLQVSNWFDLLAWGVVHVQYTRRAAFWDAVLPCILGEAPNVVSGLRRNYVKPAVSTAKRRLKLLADHDC
jgi:hypothetical protein